MIRQGESAPGTLKPQTATGALFTFELYLQSDPVEDKGEARRK